MNEERKTRLKLAAVLYLVAMATLIFSLLTSPNKEEPVKKDDISEEPKEEVITVTTKVVDDADLEVVEEEPSPQEVIDEHIRDICTMYDNVEPELVMSIVWHESRYNPNVISAANCVGLMQISPFWHQSRAYELGVENLFDPKGNILVGVDYLSELIKQYEDIKLVLMLYNMDHDKAFELYNKGEISYYAKSVLERAEMLKNGGV